MVADLARAQCEKLLGMNVKRALALCLLLTAGCAREASEPAPEPAATPAPAPTPVAAETTHDVTGAYVPMDPLPPDFAEIDHLSLATIDENAAPAPLNGFIRPKDAAARDYELDKPALSGRRLTFVTKAVNGVSYSFEGSFEVLHDFPANPPSYETPVLTGTLERVRDGKTVATTPVKFRYEAGG